MPSKPKPFGAPTENDDQFEVDMAESESNLTRIPEGLYVLKLVDLEKSTSKAGNPMWVWTFVVFEGDSAGEELKHFTALTPSALFKVAEVAAALCIPAEGSVFKFAREDVIDTLIQAYIVDDSYGGATQSKLQTLEPYGPEPGKKVKSKVRGSR